MALTAGGMEIPRTQYARSGDVSIAYEVYGRGDLNVVSVPPAASAVEVPVTPTGCRRPHLSITEWTTSAR